MTNKEAIEQLKWVRKRICDITYSPESFEAINLAIQALEERPKGKWEYIGQSEVTGLKIVKCTNCHKRQYGSMDYCGNCGADMRGGI